jgi:hypothetical protein
MTAVREVPPRCPKRERISDVGMGVDEFYKKGCQEKTSPSTGGREDFCLEIQPTVCKCPPISLRGFALACLPFLWVSSFGGDHANRVLKLGKRTLVLECRRPRSKSRKSSPRRPDM